MKKLILWITVLGMLSCTCNPGLERTFQRAGENRVDMAGGDEKSKKGHEAPFYFLNDNINKPLFL